MTIAVNLCTATTSGAQAAHDLGHERNIDDSLHTFQATGYTTSGSGSAAVTIEVSNDNIGWISLGTMSLTLTTAASSDGFSSSAPWLFARANITSISGTGATVIVTAAF